MQDEFSFLEGCEHDILHNFELNHLLRKGIEHENEVIVVRGIVFGLIEVAVCSEEQFSLFLLFLVMVLVLYLGLFG